MISLYQFIFPNLVDGCKTVCGPLPIFLVSIPTIAETIIIYLRRKPYVFNISSQKVNITVVLSLSPLTFNSVTVTFFLKIVGKVDGF